MHTPGRNFVEKVVDVGEAEACCPGVSQQPLLVLLSLQIIKRGFGALIVEYRKTHMGNGRSITTS